MTSPVFSHLLGSLTLLGVMIIIIATFVAVQFIVESSLQELRLSEVAESIAREIVELASIYTLGGSDLSYMDLKIPESLKNQGYKIELQDLGNGRFVVRVNLQVYQQVCVVVVPNFGERVVQVVEGEKWLTNNIYVSNTLLLPLPTREVGNTKLTGKPVIIAYTSQDGVLYIGLGVIWGES